MKKTTAGFTLIELMIVIAIIAIIAAIAIPSLMRSRIVANESNAKNSIKTLHTVQATWRNGDTDGNGTKDYWTLDIAGLYGVPDSNGDPVAQIQVNFARADGGGGATYSLASIGIPMAGYLYQAMSTDADGNDYNQDPDSDGTSNSNANLYGVCAYPDNFGATGRQTVIIDQQGVVYTKDNGGVPQDSWPGDDPTDPGNGAWATVGD
jgi:prepilin-type N-terminal cleavage/methylation domain-containing protein